MIVFTLEIYFILIVSVYWILILGWIKTYFSKPTLQHVNATTSINILVAARNEQDTIIDCLKALNNIDYPAHLMQIFIGDDDSTDNTAELIKEFIVDKPQFRLVSIIPNKYTSGKANVLAQLIKTSNAEHIFITDADVQVPTTWVKSMLKYVANNTGIVTGYTHISSKNWSQNFQALDWAFAQGLMYVFFEADQAITAMGNNMYISRKAYNEVGGYENLPFSITEDYALFEAVSKKGYDCIQVTNANVCANTLAIDGFKAVLQQRQRWVKGSLGKLSWLLLLLFVIQIMFIPTFLYELIMKDWEFALYAFATKTGLQSVFLFLIYKKVKKPFHWSNLLFFDWYYFIINISLIVYFIFNPKTIWKDRIYD